jgi:hypothetical protein
MRRELDIIFSHLEGGGRKSLFEEGRRLDESPPLVFALAFVVTHTIHGCFPWWDETGRRGQSWTDKDEEGEGLRRRRPIIISANINKCGSSTC